MTLKKTVTRLECVIKKYDRHSEHPADIFPNVLDLEYVIRRMEKFSQSSQHSADGRADGKADTQVMKSKRRRQHHTGRHAAPI